MNKIVRRMLGESVWDPPPGKKLCPVCEGMGYLDDDGNPQGPDHSDSEPCYQCNGERFVPESLDEVRPVIEDSRPVTFHRCPHCQEEIHEKSLFTEDIELPYMIHRPCGGKVLLPEPDPSTVAEWLRPAVEDQVRKRREWLKQNT